MRKNRPKKSIDANLLIINFDNKIEESVDMKDRAITPYTSDQTVSIALWIITNKGLFVKDIRVWKKKDTVEKRVPLQRPLHGHPSGVPRVST